VDLSHAATDDELRAELEIMRLALNESLGRPLDARVERQTTALVQKIEAIKAELARRKAPEALIKVSSAPPPGNQNNFHRPLELGRRPTS
jgi:hypothetical protein